MSALCKTLNLSVYFTNYKVVSKPDTQHLTIANEYAVISFLIHGDNQQWLSFNINGSVTYTTCRELVGLMNDLEGNNYD